MPSNIASADDNITFKKLEVQTPLLNMQAAAIVHLPSAAIYSIIETAKANGFNVYTYLNYLLERMPNMNWAVNPEVLETLMPWDDQVQQACRGVNLLYYNLYAWETRHVFI